MTTTDSNPGAFWRYSVAGFLTIAILFAAIWVWVIEAPLTYLDREYSIYWAKIELVQKGESGSVPVLGDSRALAAMIPSRIGSGVVNLALPGASAIEVYYQSQRLLAGPDRPKAVILSLSPFLFTDPDYFWKRSAEFGFLTGPQIDEVRLRSRALNDNSIFGRPSPGDIDARIKGLLYSIKFPPLYFPALVKAAAGRRYGINLKMLDSVLAERGQVFLGMANGSTKLDEEADLKSFVPVPVVDDYFNQTLALYQSQNIPVYFIAVPHNEFSEKHYFPGFREAYTAYLTRYAAQYTDFHILGDPFPSYPSADFGDETHLNKSGADRWSDSVAALLTDSHVDGGPFGPNGP